MRSTQTDTRQRLVERAHEPCSHFGAEQTHATEARPLRDGGWEYRTAYHCPTCATRFTETHRQAVRGDAVE
jgi:hypothetical protein